MNIVILVQARMTSTRLPGKVLKMVLGKSLLQYQLERLQHVKQAKQLVVATTTNPTDDPIVQLCQTVSVETFRGDEQNVLERFYLAAKQFHVDVVVRVTSDCPLIDPDVIDQAIAMYLESPDKTDYVSNGLEPTFPRGLDVEVFSFQALERAYFYANKEWEKEHVTPYMYTRPSEFLLKNLSHTENLSHHRWTVDTKEDLTLITAILEELYPKKPDFRLSDVIQLLEENPDWVTLNHHIEQKSLYDTA